MSTPFGSAAQFKSGAGPPLWCGLDERIHDMLKNLGLTYKKGLFIHVFQRLRIVSA